MIAGWRQRSSLSAHNGRRRATRSRRRWPRRTRPTRATGSAWRCGSSASIEDGIAARERAFEGYVRDGRCDEAARVARRGSRTSTCSPAAPRPRAAGSRAPSARSRAPTLRGPRLGRRRARAPRRERRGVRRARAPRDGDRPRDRRRATSRSSRSACSAGPRSAPGAGEEGMELLEEAMAAASAGRVRNVHTLAEAYCNLIMACTSAGDWERAAEWCELVDEFAREHGTDAAARRLPHDPRRRPGRARAAGPRPSARCRARSRRTRATSRAWARRPSPRWPSCASARAACRRPSSCSPGARSTRRRCARWPSCASPRASRRWPPRCSSAGCSACDGDAMRHDAAARAARRRAPGLRATRTARADAAARARASSPRSSGIRLVAGARRPRRGARRARGRSPGRGRRARAPGARRVQPRSRCRSTPARRASSSRARWRPRRPTLAARRGARRLAAFRELGASRAMDAAAAVLRDLGGATGARPRSHGELTAREQEVLGLLALGMSNARIAQTLFISEKTAGPPRQPHPLEARRPQPRRGGRARRPRRVIGERR